MKHFFMSPEELKRYNRHIILPGFGIEAQEKLKSAKVLVIGAGGLGCPVLQYLAAAGVGTLGIVDFDMVDVSNLQRQVLYTVDDVGRPKAEVAAEKLARLNPFVTLKTHNLKLSTSNVIDVFKEYDLVVDGSDNFPTRYLVNDACVMLKKPLVFGSIFKFEGQVSVFNYQGGPTYRCLFPEPPTPGESPACSEIGVIGVLPGIIGTLQANEVIKVITGTGEVLSGKVLVFNALNMSTLTFSFSKVAGNDSISSFADYEDFCGLRKEDGAAIREISAEELKAWISEGKEFQLVDVREDYEYEEGNLDGLLIPLDILEKEYEKIRRDIPVVIHCQQGLRSRTAINNLNRKYGYTNLYNLSGGYNAWE